MRARAYSAITSATATAGRSSFIALAPSSTRLAAVDSAIAPTLALEDLSVCAASRIASRSGSVEALSSCEIRRGASSRNKAMMRAVSSPAISCNSSSML